MDRRQRKTREAVFTAFSSLLSQKRFSKITVEEIIELAKVYTTLSGNKSRVFGKSRHPIIPSKGQTWTF